MSSVPFPAITIRSNPTLAASERYLRSKHNLLAGYDSVEDLVTDDGMEAKDLEGIQHHLVAIRAAIAKAIWSREIYIGVSVLDEFVLHAAKTGAPDICGRVIDLLRNARACQPGFVLYPLTEFGMRLPPMFGHSSRRKDHAVFTSAGFAVCSQAHGPEGVLQNIRMMSRKLGITARVKREDIEHYSRGNMRWLTSNPLMLVRLASHTGAYYENQFVYTLKIRISSAIVVMLHALSVDAGQEVDKFESSAHVNNSETLDIRHYLIGEGPTSGQGPISLQRIPMNVGAMELARLSDLAVTLDTEVLTGARSKRWEGMIVPLLKSVEDGYLKHVNLSSKDAVKSRVYRRLVTALDWYRQSFGSRANEQEAVVALAVAFETLLTDFYAKGVSARIERRVGICLKGVPGVQNHKNSVMSVFHARGEIVHSGDFTKRADLRRAQAAFARCFYAVARRLPSLSGSPQEPMRQILADNP